MGTLSGKAEVSARPGDVSQRWRAQRLESRSRERIARGTRERIARRSEGRSEGRYRGACSSLSALAKTAFDPPRGIADTCAGGVAIERRSPGAAAGAPESNQISGA